MTTTCVTCTRPVPGTEYGCEHCAETTTDRLAGIAELAPAARAVAARQTRRGPAVHTGSAGSRLPLNLAAAQRIDSVRNEIGTWVRHVAETRGAYPDRVPPGFDVLPGSARFLGAHVEWFRHRGEWAEFAADVAAAERVLRGVVDGPGERELVGACPCGTALYARPGRAVVACPDCQAEWGTVESRQILIRHVEDMLLTAAEIAGLAVVQDPERDRTKVRKLINVWSSRATLTPAGVTVEGDPTYRVGEVLARLADVRTRVREAVS